jgi:hypothetical protein
MRYPVTLASFSLIMKNKSDIYLQYMNKSVTFNPHYYGMRMWTVCVMLS